jgi:hypothetical protein
MSELEIGVLGRRVGGWLQLTALNKTIQEIRQVHVFRVQNTNDTPQMLPAPID